MRVLLLFPMRDGQTGPAIRYAFLQLGHTVQAVDAKIAPRLSFKTACDFKPDLVFCSRTDTLADQVVRIKQKFPSAVVCTWQVDTRSNIGHWKHLFPLIRACDYYFVVASRLIPEWKKINPNTFWLPQGLQSEIYKKPFEITDADKKKYSCDVSWTGHLGGSSHQFRKGYAEAIQGMDVKIKFWGCAGVPAVFNENHNKMVALSKVNICCSAFPQNDKTTSVRNYKILGAGGFMLELYRKGINDIFPQDTMDSYKSPANLVEKIHFWLTHEKERQARSEKGYNWVRNFATYTHRIKTALEYMGM